jgi:lipopolysaccharide transport system ATP-binding protein
VSEIAIRARGLGKSYRIGAAVQRHDNLREVLVHAATAPLRNLRGLRGVSPAARSSNGKQAGFFWALQDVSFDVKHGEVLGIIGRNGAGKSTLLKILSRITEPSVGRAEVSGRIGSLLEVGTGFHPELTGRENVYLNGSILGMDRGYIARQFDAIVEFSGVERFLDTPVKRYSSGMYLRLAFAVAAYLEPEVLIVDEVLAVGDAEFQRKCLGRMGEVAREGRTILFVSHNMGAIRALCSRALLLQGGRVVLDADADSTVNHYLSAGGASSVALVEWPPENAPQSAELRFLGVGVVDEQGEYVSSLDCRQEFSIVVEYEVLRPIAGLRIGFLLETADGIPLCGSNDPDAWSAPVRHQGRYTSRCTFPGHLLNTGRYRVAIAADAAPYTGSLVRTTDCVSFTVEDTEGHGARKEQLPGILRPSLVWQVTQLERETIERV